MTNYEELFQQITENRNQEETTFPKEDETKKAIILSRGVQKVIDAVYSSIMEISKEQVANIVNRANNNGETQAIIWMAKNKIGSTYWDREHDYEYQIKPFNVSYVMRGPVNPPKGSSSKGLNWFKEQGIVPLQAKLRDAFNPFSVFVNVRAGEATINLSWKKKSSIPVE